MKGVVSKGIDDNGQRFLELIPDVHDRILKFVAESTILLGVGLQVVFKSIKAYDVIVLLDMSDVLDIIANMNKAILVQDNEWIRGSDLHGANDGEIIDSQVAS